MMPTAIAQPSVDPITTSAAVNCSPSRNGPCDTPSVTMPTMVSHSPQASAPGGAWTSIFSRAKVISGSITPMA